MQVLGYRMESKEQEIFESIQAIKRQFRMEDILVLQIKAQKEENIFVGCWTILLNDLEEEMWVKLKSEKPRLWKKGRVRIKIIFLGKENV